MDELGGLARTIKAGLGSRIGAKMELTHPAVPWIIKHAASVTNCFVVRDCGKTSYERIKGRRCIEPIACFGELVFFRPTKTRREKEHKDSWRDRFAEGLWLGSNMRTSESIVGTRDGVFRAGAIRQKPADKRWSAAFLHDLRAVYSSRSPSETAIGCLAMFALSSWGGRSLPPQPVLPLLLQMTPRESGAYMFEKKT